MVGVPFKYASHAGVLGVGVPMASTPDSDARHGEFMLHQTGIGMDRRHADADSPRDG